ncbi:MAG: HEPN domain-containing protein [Verrucomicrobiota bacterium]
MSYRKSRARIAFEASTDELLRLSRFASIKKNQFSYSHQNLVYQSAIFRACASIEEYLKAFCEDLIFCYKTKGAKLSELPSNLRASALLNRQKELFKSYIVIGDEVSTLKSLQPGYGIYKLCQDEDILSSQLGKHDVLGTQKYPSIKNLKVVFNRLGVGNIMDEAHKRGKKDYKTQLESFLSVREAISHQLPPPLTFEDVKRHFHNVADLLNQFDRILFAHVVKVSAMKYWPS